MKLRDIVELLVLAALWGGSFLFMRVLAPVVGPLATADLRMLIGGLFLGAVFLVLRFDPGLKKNFLPFLVVGLVNSALPFLLYSVAALVLPASVEVVLNALSPAFGAVAGALFLGERLTWQKAAGLALGFAGVIAVAGGLNLGSDPWAWAALVACSLAPVSYAVGGVLVKKLGGGIAPQSLAFGSQLLAGLALLPALALAPPPQAPTAEAWVLLAAFGILCSGVAYLLYYGLMKRIGPTKTLTVTFLMPVFGIVWGALLLNEPVTWTLALGAALILGGTALVTRR
jgi:drug/metabolite transporter (DMT)-like permease